MSRKMHEDENLEMIGLWLASSKGAVPLARYLSMYVEGL